MRKVYLVITMERLQNLDHILVLRLSSCIKNVTCRLQNISIVEGVFVRNCSLLPSAYCLHVFVIIVIARKSTQTSQFCLKCVILGRSIPFIHTKFRVTQLQLAMKTFLSSNSLRTHSSDFRALGSVNPRPADRGNKEVDSRNLGPTL